MLEDGYQSLVTIAADTNIDFWEKTSQPPGLDGGEPIPITTMHNVLYRTFVARELITLTPISFTAAYDPAVYDQILAVLNVHTTITVSFSDGSTIAFYGYLQKFEAAALVEGTQPEATITIVPTNYDPVNHVEAGPVVTSVTGT